jgi:preprotein translocase subunit SecE
MPSSLEGQRDSASRDAANSDPASRDSGQRIRVVPEELTLVVWPLRQEPIGSLVALVLCDA